MTASSRTALDAGFHIIVPVWGESYTRLFAEVSLPTLLAPGNIPALPHRERHVFSIYTTPDSRCLIESTPAFARLKEFIRVEFHPVRARVDQIGNPYDVQSDCYRRAIRHADAVDKAIVFLTPDIVMSDGSLRGLARIAASSARAVIGVGVRLDKAQVRDRLLAHHCSATGDAIAITPHALARLALKTLHPIAKAHMFHAEGEHLGPSNLYWRVGSEGLLARCFHLHPFLVYPRVKNAPFAKSIDGDYLEAACPDPDDIHVITDSDEFSAWELSDADRRLPMVPRSLPLADLAKWVRDKTTQRHRGLIQKVIRLHCGVTDHALWQRVERESSEAVGKLLASAELLPAAAVQSTISPLRFMTAVRNLDEARAFIEIALPSALAPGNIPRLPNRASSLYTIAAPPTCAQFIESSPAYAELREHMPAAIHVVTENAAVDPRFAASFRVDALREAAANDAAAVFVDPDVVLAETSVAAAVRTCQSGVRAIITPRLHIAADAAASLLRQIFTAGGLLSISSEALVRLAMAHLHPASTSQLACETPDFVDPDAMLWRVEDEELVMHAFGYDPFVVRPRRAPQAASTLSEALLGSGLREEEIVLFRESGRSCNAVSRHAPPRRPRCAGPTSGHGLSPAPVQFSGASFAMSCGSAPCAPVRHAGPL